MQWIKEGSPSPFNCSLRFSFPNELNNSALPLKKKKDLKKELISRKLRLKIFKSQLFKFEFFNLTFPVSKNRYTGQGEASFFVQII